MSDDQNNGVPAQNDQLVLISGKSGTGKSTSLMNIRDQKRWMYLNTEAGKRLPFKNNFDAHTITDPYQVHEGFDYATNDGVAQYDGIIVDSLTFLMDMFETQYIVGSANTMAAWGAYQQFFKTLMQQKVPLFGKPVLIIAHTLDVLNEKAMEIETSVPIKGALKNQGVEAYFSTVVSPKKMTLKDLEPYASDLLHIEEDDEILGYKHVFQTRLTKTTVGERIRSPMGMFTREQSFIDPDAQLLLDHLKAFYE
ncbi:MAG: hypothetical protein Unbinned4120contig1000_2 [Prokaryotic dsDNA virus sp.]|jgi:DNA polymerase III delta prime subunit|nr:MAG: hypothetical protein Unbinned4120contig1000_2 [Prokaryotic dsDNA virus sp.]|tara:strand:- start:2066 stop:2821 length:756 start_codon:yes stop_codon:yes gene_type:complete